jgi:hypothetical protein
MSNLVRRSEPLESYAHPYAVAVGADGRLDTFADTPLAARTGRALRDITGQ